jgi:hypothetical protein
VGPVERVKRVIDILVERVIDIPVGWVIGIGGLVLGVVGLVVGVKIANHHARKASAELREEVDRLHLLLTHLAIYMQEAGLVKEVRLDEKGRLKLWQPVRPATGNEPRRDSPRLLPPPAKPRRRQARGRWWQFWR